MERNGLETWQSSLLHVFVCYFQAIWYGAEKMETYTEIFGNIMQKKVTIMRKRHQIMQKFLKSKTFP